MEQCIKCGHTIKDEFLRVSPETFVRSATNRLEMIDLCTVQNRRLGMAFHAEKTLRLC